MNAPLVTYDPGDHEIDYGRNKNVVAALPCVPYHKTFPFQQRTWIPQR
jgi:hypothetical protein